MDFLVKGRLCPRCGASILMDPDQDFIIVGHGDGKTGGVWIRVGWQEFRILSIWSRFWADQQARENPSQWGWMLRAIDSITHQLKKLDPDWPLTIADDAAIAKKQNPEKEVKATRADGSEVQLEPTWLNSEITRHEPPAPQEK